MRSRAYSTIKNTVLSTVAVATLTLSFAADAGWGNWSPAATGLPRFDENGGAIQYCFNSEDDPRWMFGTVQVDDFLKLAHSAPGGEVVILKALPGYWEWLTNLRVLWYGDLEPWGFKEFLNQPYGMPGWAAFPIYKNNTRAHCQVS